MELPEIKKPKFLENLELSDYIKIGGAALGAIGIFLIAKLGEEYIPEQIEPVEVNDISSDEDGDVVEVITSENKEKTEE